MKAKRPGQRASRGVTRDDVARVAGVSPVTASLALNNHPRVAQETRQRVALAAEQLGFSFSANYAARRLAGARFGTRSARFDQIGLVYPAAADTPMDGGCLALMREAEQELATRKACMVFVRAGRREDWEKVRRLAHTGIVDAWMILGPVDDKTIKQFKPLGLPFVILGEHRCTTPVHAVNIDNAGLGRLAVEHLSSLGHRRIAYVASTKVFQYQEQVLRGWRAGVRQMGLDDDPQLTAYHPAWGDLKTDNVRAWLGRLGRRPTAIVCEGLHKAELMFRALRDIGLNVPGDISLLPWDFASSPPWSSNMARIEMPVAELGRQGAMLLHKVVTDTGVQSSDIKLSSRLVEGWSVAAPITSAG